MDARRLVLSFSSMDAWWSAAPPWFARFAPWLSAGMALTILVSVALLPYWVAHLPEDYFVRPVAPQSWSRRALQRLGGVVVILLGVLMLALPGQGILTILVGLWILDHPVARRGAAWILRRPSVASWVTRLRRKAGTPPLRMEPVSPPSD